MNESVLQTTITRTFLDGSTEELVDLVAIEEPLELRIEGKATAVLMRTPGRDLDLCLGFLCTEGVIEDKDDIVAIAHIDSPSRPKGNTVDVRLSSGVPLLRREKADRSFFASSSCGICGKESIDRIISEGPIITQVPQIPPSLLFSLPEQLREAQKGFAHTGGIHAVGLFDLEGKLKAVEEDVGRHNALDKLIGKAVRNDWLPLTDHILLLSGRAGFELLQKSWVAQIPIVVAIGAPTSLAIDLAERAGIQLHAFLRTNKCNQYTKGGSR
jgi:FdhD protein